MGLFPLAFLPFYIFPKFPKLTPDKFKSLCFFFSFLGKLTNVSLFIMHAFLIRNTFISNARVKLAKNQANARQHTWAEILLFENYSLSSSKLSYKNDRIYSKKDANEQCACIHKIINVLS